MTDPAVKPGQFTTQMPTLGNLNDNSRERFNALESFHDALGGPTAELYLRWINHPSSNPVQNPTWQSPIGQGAAGTEVEGDGTPQTGNARLEQLCDFALGYLASAAKRADLLSGDAQAIAQGQNSAAKQLSEAWHGSAAEAALDKFNELQKPLDEYGKVLKGFSGILTQLHDTVDKAVSDIVRASQGSLTPSGEKAGSVNSFLAHNFDESYCGGQQMYLDNLAKANQWGRAQDDDWEVATSAPGTGPVDWKDLPHLSIDLDTGFTEKWSDMFCREMDDFAQLYSDTIKLYRTQIRMSYDTVAQALRTFVNALNVPTDPFGALGMTSGGGTGSGGGNSSTGGPGGVSHGGGGTRTPNIPAMTAPAADIPPMPTPAMPEMPAASTQPETAVPTVLNPITHLAADIDPVTGQPYPIDPRTGASIKDQSLVDTVSVKQGADTISMSEPDKSGKMTVSVDDGSGHLRSYQLNFGDGQTTSGIPAASAVSSVPVDGSQLSALQAQLSPPSATTDAVPADHAYTADADGKIHVEEGNLKISAERLEGPNGPTSVTIDNGSGPPETYTLNSQQPTPSTMDTPALGTAMPVSHSDSLVSPSHVPDGSSPQGFPAQSHSVPTTVDSGHIPDGSSVSGGDSAIASNAVDSGVPVQSTTPSDAYSYSDTLSGDTLSGGSNHAAALGDTGYLDAGQDAVSAQKAHSGTPGDLAGLGSAPVGGQASDPTGGMGGMGMMGGMMGGAGGYGGDQERSSSAYQAPGSPFGDYATGNRISGSLNDDDTSYEYGK